MRSDAQQIKYVESIQDNPFDHTPNGPRYGQVNKVDLLVGILAEDHLPGKSFGKTMNKILKTQFEMLRDGDYYFYKNNSFLPAAIRTQIAHSTFADVLKRNTTLTNLQSNVFFSDKCTGDTLEEDWISAVLPGIEGKVYPNPVKDVLHLTFQGDDDVYVIYIYSTSGMLVRTINWKAIDPELQIPVNELPAGMYLLRVMSSKSTKSFRFVKSAN
jgi:hypothetical protein